MADILICGMEMPKDWDLWLCIDTDGTVYNVKPVITGTAQEVGTAIPLPEGHGRLIDADALERVCKEIADCEWNKKAAPYSWEYAYNQFIDDEIFNAPTIVPAEGRTDECSEN